MSFQQLLFPFVFLPVGFLLFRITPSKLKKPVLLALSLLFIVWGRPFDLLFVLLSGVFNYASGREIALFKEKDEQKRARLVLVSAVTVNVLLLGFFKYYNFAARELGELLKINVAASSLPAPAGISFFTFSELSFLFDVYRDKAPAPKKPLDFALFVTFFPKFSSGPIIPYHEMLSQMEKPVVTRMRTETGLRVFLVGLFKKVLLADTLALTFNAVSKMDPSGLPMLTAWIGALSYSFMLYFDFSGYSDMALGLGRMFGFNLPVNFKHPYTSQSISDFWRRWHASLGAWFRDYVYIPLGGSREGNLRTIRNLLVVWLLTGIWHGANYTFILWGLFHGTLIIIEKFVLKKPLEKIPAPIKQFFTFIAAVIGWVLFFSPDVGSAARFLQRMAAFGSFSDARSLYLLRTSLPALIIAAFGSTPVLRNLAVSLERDRPKWLYVAEILLFAVGLMLCIAGMVGSTNTTFLYSQF